MICLINLPKGLYLGCKRTPPLAVSLVTGELELKAGEVYVAGKNTHLVLTPRMHLNYLPEASFSTLLNKPFIDIFFNSVARVSGLKGIACLLKGMGSDGAQGLLNLKNIGFDTIIEDSSTAVFYGMPRAARELDAAQFCLPIELIGAKIRELTLKKNTPTGTRS